MTSSIAGTRAVIDLPGGAIGTPMTYTHDGRQYIALTVGGDLPELVAFALPYRVFASAKPGSLLGKRGAERI